MTDQTDEKDAEKESGEIVTWYGLLIGYYLANIPPDEVRRFICLDMATEGVPGDAAVKAAQAYEKFLMGKGPKAVE